MIDHVVAVSVDESAVPTTGPYWPVGTDASESASELQTWPEPVLQSACRAVTEPGSAKPVVSEVLSAQ